MATGWKPDDPKLFEEQVRQGWSQQAQSHHWNVSEDRIYRTRLKLGLTRQVDQHWPGANKAPRRVHDVRTDTAGLSEFRDRLLADIAEDTKARARIRWKPPKEKPQDKDVHALEVCLFDLHIGKLAWSDETGHTSYDSAIAQDIAQAATNDLLKLASGFQVDEIILPIGNDLMHSDSFAGQTTAGTKVDVDTRFPKMFRRARSLVAWMIELCASRAPVRAIIVPGNHDQQSAFCLGEVLAAEFKNDPRVSFDDAPRGRKYHLYGKNLLGFEHGKNMPEQRLVKLMPVEVPHLWAESTVREIHLGHLHKSKKVEPIYVDESEGVTVRRIRALSGVDAWHSENGFIGTRGAEAFVWRKSGGLRAHLFHQLV